VPLLMGINRFIIQSNGRSINRSNKLFIKDKTINDNEVN
jgi:hypothetical protein